jgi:hypothetical protein
MDKATCHLQWLPHNAQVVVALRGGMVQADIELVAARMFSLESK